MDNHIKYGIVFAGGGAKGAYQIGVWQALLKLRVPIGGVVGASIGAINAALLAQGDWLLAKKAWSKLDLSQVVQLEEPLAKPDNLFDIRNLNQVLRNVFTQKGLDMEPIRKLLQEYIDEDKVRQSDIDFGIISYDLTNQKALEIFKESMEPDAFFDYIMASACFPVFKSVEINGKKFMDGGVYNNMPSSMLVNKGYTHLILVDIGGVGIVRPPKGKNLNIMVIKPKNPLGGTFDMSAPTLKRSIRLGYLDTYKAYGRLTGNSFYLSSSSATRFILQYNQDTLDGLEIAGLRYGLTTQRIYTVERLQKAVLAEFDKDCQKYILLGKKGKQGELKTLLSAEPSGLSQLKKDFVLPAVVDALNEKKLSGITLEAARKLMPATMKAAQALCDIGATVP